MNAVFRSAVAAALLAVPVTVETTWSAVDDLPAMHLLFAASQVIGWGLLGSLCHDLKGSASGGSRARTVGAWLVLAACALQVAFGLTYGVSVALTGEPEEATFLLFALGFLALTIGGVTWGQSLLRSGANRLAGIALPSVAVLGLGAILVSADPRHDILLVGSYLTWILVGLATHPARRVAAAEDLHPASR